MVCNIILICLSINYSSFGHIKLLIYCIYFNRYGSWGICFIYGTLFAVKGLVAAGSTYENSSFIRKACGFLLSKQLCTGGWGESYMSSETMVRDYYFSLCFFTLKHIREHYVPLY
jgi:hypothetical protein